MTFILFLLDFHSIHDGLKDEAVNLFTRAIICIMSRMYSGLGVICQLRTCAMPNNYTYSFKF